MDRKRFTGSFHYDGFTFGAGTDYCLFLISKYREILFDVEDKTVAMKLAVKESGGAILMSALTVVIGLATLSLAHYGAFQRFAVPFSFGVLVMGIAALVVLPAILVLIGRVAFFPFTPRTEEMANKRARNSISLHIRSVIKLVILLPINLGSLLLSLLSYLED